MKTWKAAGIEAKWIPYAGGGKAMAALLGGHGTVYVGNPQDVIGRPDLKVAVIASPKRLGGQFADVPTFAELGVQGLDDEIMWRGFMTKKKAYIEKGGATPVMLGTDEFTAMVNKDKQEFATALKDLGVIK